MNSFFIATSECNLDFHLLYELAHDYLGPSDSGLTDDEHELLLTIFGEPGELNSAWKPDFLMACHLLFGQLQRLIAIEQGVPIISRVELRKLEKQFANFIGFIRTLPNVIVWGTDEEAVTSLSNIDWSVLDKLPHFQSMTLRTNMSRKWRLAEIRENWERSRAT